jgi:selenocysteine lyase/cysteine desulfurase
MIQARNSNMQSSGESISEFHQLIRKEFPRADVDANGRQRIFFENGAGSLVLQRAAKAEEKARVDYSANVGGPYWESKMNEKTIADGRKAVRDFLNAPSENCIISGESATSLLFCLSYAMSKGIVRSRECCSYRL